MKTPIALKSLILISVIAVLPVRAAEGPMTEERERPGIEQRFREVDLELAVHQYQRLRMEAFEARLEIELLSTEPDIPDREREVRINALERRADILTRRAMEIRERAMQFRE